MWSCLPTGSRRARRRTGSYTPSCESGLRLWARCIYMEHALAALRLRLYSICRLQYSTSSGREGPNNIGRRVRWKKVWLERFIFHVVWSAVCPAALHSCCYLYEYSRNFLRPNLIRTMEWAHTIQPSVRPSMLRPSRDGASRVSRLSAIYALAGANRPAKRTQGYQACGTSRA